MATIDVTCFRPYEFLKIAFENTNAFGFSDIRVHSFIVDGKKEFFKKPYFVRSWVMFSEFHAKYLLHGEGTN